MNANELRDAGIESAINHADHVYEDWSVRAFSALKDFIDGRESSFMCEEVRDFAIKEHGLPRPPSERAWGDIIVKASKAGLIKHAGYSKTKSRTAHRTPAAVWVAA